MARPLPIASLLALSLLSVGLPACGGGAGSGGGAGTPVVAFVADLDVDDRNALYVVDANGDRAQVSGPNTLGEGVYDFEWSPDRSKIAFVDDKTVSGERDVFVVSANGGTPVNLTGSHIPGFNVNRIWWSPDGSRLLLSGTFDVGGDWGLATIPAGGGSIDVISPAGAQVYYATEFWSPDSTAVAFQASVAGEMGYFLAEADGSSTKKVSGTLVAGGAVQMFQNVNPWAADGSRLAFRADKTTDEKVDIYTVKRDGTGLVNVSATIAATFDAYDISWAPVGARLAFLTVRDGYPYDGHVFTTDGAGGAPLEVSLANGSARTIAWRPDGQKIAYRDWDGVAQTLRLTDPVIGGSVLLATLTGNVTSIEDDVRWSPDGTRVAYRAGEFGGAGSSDDHFRLFSVKPGETPALLSTSVFGPAGNVDRFAWSPDGQRVAFACELLSGDGSGVYTSPAAGGGDVLESTPSVEASFFRFSPTEPYLVWEEGADTGDYRLFGADAGGTTPLLPVTPATTDLSGFAPR